MKSNVDILKEKISAYSFYVIYNAENNIEFGKSWFPVCFDEFIDNEYSKYEKDTSNDTIRLPFEIWYK